MIETSNVSGSNVFGMSYNAGVSGTPIPGLRLIADWSDVTPLEEDYRTAVSPEKICYKRGIIYALIDPRTNEIRYVGKSHRTAHRRLRRHLAPCYLVGNTHKERWIRQLLARGLEPLIVVLEECTTANDLEDAERKHIRQQKELGARLTNLTDGGDGGSGNHTPESREKIRRALTGKPKSEEHKRRSAEGQRGRIASEETREKLRIAHRRPRGSYDEKRRIAISRGMGCSPFCDQSGVVYQTQKSAARMLGLNVGHLNEVLHGSRKSVKGMKFKFIEKSDLRVQQFPEVTRG